MLLLGVLLVSLVLSDLVVGGEVKGVGQQCSFPAIYNFGDSNSDTGSYSAAVLAVREPCGETFFGKPVGRVCDGRLIIDFIAEHLGLPHLSSYMDSIGTNYSHGANFASASATIGPPASTASTPFSLEFQTAQFKQFKSRVIDLYNQGKNTDRLPRPEDFSRALYTIDIGQNDVTMALFGDPLPVIRGLVDKLGNGVKNLYNEGARTFWIHNTGPEGCLPLYINEARRDAYGCDMGRNAGAMEFNRQLREKVIQLRGELPEASITYVDVYSAKYELIGNGKKLGFSGDPFVWCTPHRELGLCSNPESYISWDGIHYTEAVNRLVAKNIVGGFLSDPPVPIPFACHRDADASTLVKPKSPAEIFS
ncbi:GDSL esterase/lipase At5g14450-like [Diospyros lotus]|uniref:GDSL esterase/lipase At5g14450-like n=1 Tax=Diospyros lotus TaxID=55363 RepID=UPI00224FA1EF|nr:GDSL esterase/lipase At5g14450-like [Diospyros lotus]